MIFGTHNPQLKHLKYAYAGTIHASQGKTVDNVIAVMESDRPVLNNQKSFYVTISRPRDNVELITDDTIKLQSTIERHTGESLSALDLFNHHKHDEIGKSLSTQINDQMLNPEKSSDQQQEKEETKIDEMNVENDRQMDIEM